DTAGRLTERLGAASGALRRGAAGTRGLRAPPAGRLRGARGFCASCSPGAVCEARSLGRAAAGPLLATPALGFPLGGGSAVSSAPGFLVLKCTSRRDLVPRNTSLPQRAPAMRAPPSPGSARPRSPPT